MKEKYFWAGIVIVVISWLGNYFYFQAQQIETPIFLKHYYEQEFQTENQLTFYYLTNLNDTREVNYATINGVEIYPERDLFQFMWSNEQPQISFYQQFTHQGVRQVHFKVMEEMVGKDSDGNWAFSEMTIHFNDGTSTTQPIGEVILRERAANQVEGFHTVFSSGSNAGLHENGFKLLKDGSITRIDVPFSSVLPEGMTIKIIVMDEKVDWTQLNEIPKDIFPIEVKEGETIYVSVKVDNHQQKIFGFPVKIEGQTSDGIPFTGHTRILSNPYFTEDRVDEIIASFEGSVQ